MIDVDVLIRRQDRDQAAKLLLDSGFVRYEAAHRPATTRGFHHWIFFCDKPLPFALELHIGICRPHRARIDYDKVFQRAVVRVKNKRLVPTLCSEDTLLFAALHEARHGYIVPQRSAEDTARVITRWRPTWATVVSRARLWRVQTALYLTLAAANAARPGVVPCHVLHCLCPSVARRSLLQFIVDDHGRARFPHSARYCKLLSLLGTVERSRDVLLYISEMTRLRALDIIESKSLFAPNS